MRTLHTSDTSKTIVGLQVLPSSITILRKLARYCDLYTVAQCSSVEEEQMYISILQNESVFEAGLPQHKVLFCTTLSGRQAICRHLEPHLCIEVSDTVARTIKPFVRDTILVRPACPPQQNNQVVHDGNATPASTIDAKVTDTADGSDTVLRRRLVGNSTQDTLEQQPSHDPMATDTSAVHTPQDVTHTTADGTGSCVTPLTDPLGIVGYSPSNIPIYAS
uniref:Peroxisome biogenesis protein 22 n=1 Tax=Lygus hesperus TaxID=30085 RepID=A0A146LIB1_LYGHE